jgi:cytochrome c peroxidase
MNAAGGAAIAARIAAGPYADVFRRTFGDILGDPEATLAAVGRAAEAFLLSDAMAPFSSRFDAFVRGDGDLTPEEKEGLRLFQDPKKGACSRCHRVEPDSRDPARSLFTDYGYDAVGAPRNVRAGARPPDLGLCERTDATTPSNEPRYCASFRTPSLRNVALRSSFMHNGALRRLRDVVAFYATRDTLPRRWYPSGTRFDDVPPAYRGQVNVNEPPYGRREGDAPALDDREIDEVVAFLETLTDRLPP